MKRSIQWHARLGIVGFLTMFFWLTTPAVNAFAHGTVIDLADVQAIEIIAHFDSGEPMADAQVSVYAPTDAANPWLTGTADSEGRFVFTPDRALTGEWAIQVRTAGHGDWVYIDMADGDIAAMTASSGGFTTAQIILMSVAVIWGMIGTALYFARPKPTADGTPNSAAV